MADINNSSKEYLWEVKFKCKFYGENCHRTYPMTDVVVTPKEEKILKMFTDMTYGSIEEELYGGGNGNMFYNLSQKPDFREKDATEITLWNSGHSYNKYTLPFFDVEITDEYLEKNDYTLNGSFTTDIVSSKLGYATKETDCEILYTVIYRKGEEELPEEKFPHIEITGKRAVEEIAGENRITNTENIFTIKTVTTGYTNNPLIVWSTANTVFIENCWISFDSGTGSWLTDNNGTTSFQTSSPEAATNGANVAASRNGYILQEGVIQPNTTLIMTMQSNGQVVSKPWVQGIFSEFCSGSSFANDLNFRMEDCDNPNFAQPKISDNYCISYQPGHPNSNDTNRVLLVSDFVRRKENNSGLTPHIINPDIYQEVSATSIETQVQFTTPRNTYFIHDCAPSSGPSPDTFFYGREIEKSYPFTASGTTVNVKLPILHGFSNTGKHLFLAHPIILPANSTSATVISSLGLQTQLKTGASRYTSLGWSTNGFSNGEQHYIRYVPGTGTIEVPDFTYNQKKELIKNIYISNGYNYFCRDRTGFANPANGSNSINYIQSTRPVYTQSGLTYGSQYRLFVVLEMVSELFFHGSLHTRQEFGFSSSSSTLDLVFY